MNDSVIEINALGRSAYLGQLYNATKSELLPGFSLYKADAIKPRATNTEQTRFKIEQVKSFSDRAKTLDISAHLYVTILSGAIPISGGGSYLSKQQDTSESHTVAAIAKFRKGSCSLDLLDLQEKIALPDETLARTRATHVVTSIAYGANIVGTLTQKSLSKSDKTGVQGNFSVELFKDLSNLVSGEGRVELSKKNKELIKTYNLDVELMTDIKLGDEKMPADPAGMLELVMKSPSLVGDGVPCEIQLMPLSMLRSNIPSFRELAEADLIDISTTYDEILKLENNRLWLRDRVEEFSEIFSTFADGVRARTVTVTKLVQEARAKLREYLVKYRSSGGASDDDFPTGTTDDFLSQVTAKFTDAIIAYEDDLDQWRKFKDCLDAAQSHGFPIMNVAAIGGKMNQVGRGMLAVVLVPKAANWGALMNLYSGLSVDIRQWRTSIEKASQGEDSSNASVTQYITIYADPLRRKTLRSFDDEAGTLKAALDRAEKTKKAVFLTYGQANRRLGGLVWHILNDEGWGVITNKRQNWRYIGDVHLGKPHGSGVITYVNNTKYVGDFVFGRRDGTGKLLNSEGKEIAVFAKSSTPVQYRKLALDRFAAVRSHIDRIGKIMEWNEEDCFRLVLGDYVAQVDVIGSMIDSGESPSIENSFWPLEGAESFKITAWPL
ncbi:hypothetical protein DL93DRAFT_1851798 [Clavulina sp. PMI_390]|nr:hypothetical protein DL93DRAFT_1851798 [Clavulina sp. PMI_390]